MKHVYVYTSTDPNEVINIEEVNISIGGFRDFDGFELLLGEGRKIPLTFSDLKELRFPSGALNIDHVTRDLALVQA